MFGKGGGPLNAWIKEFCELVFIQTLQAFIFALVISFIINILNVQVTMEQSDRNASLGIICIVALTSIFKIEEIARRIFGYGPTKADHGNAVQSIGKSMMALRMGKNLLDNGKKVVGGAGAFFGGRKAMLKAQDRKMKRLKALELDNGGDGGNAPQTNLLENTDKNNNMTSANKGARQSRELDPAKRAKKIALQKDAEEARKRALNEKDEKKKKALIAEAKSKLAEARSIDDTLVETKAPANSNNSNNNSNNTGGNANSNNRRGIKDYYQKKLQIEEDFKDKESDIKKKRREGIKQMVSGVAESGAALVGFTAGTAMGAASTNDWGEAAKSGITWAGTADALTAGTVDFAFGAEEFLANRGRNLAGLAGETIGNIQAAYKEELKNADRQIQSGNEQLTRSAQQDIDKAIADAEKASAGAYSKGDAGSSSRTPSVKGSSKYNSSTRSTGSTRTSSLGGATKAGVTRSTVDSLTAGKVDLTFGAEEVLANRERNLADMSDKTISNIQAAYKEELKNADRQIQSGNEQLTRSAQQDIDKAIADAEKAAAGAYSKGDAGSSSKAPSVKVSTSSNSSARSTGSARTTSSSRGPSVLNAVKKGIGKTYTSHSIKAQDKLIKDTIDRLDKMYGVEKVSDTDGNVLH